MGTVTNPLGSLINGLLTGHNLGMQILQEKRNQEAFNRQLAVQDEESQIRDIQNRMMLEHNARPINAGTVSDTLPAPPSVEGAPVPDMGPIPLVRTPDKSRVVKYKDRAGQAHEYELYSPEEQIQRQVDQARAMAGLNIWQKGEEAKAVQDATLKAAGIDIPVPGQPGATVRVLPKDLGGIGRYNQSVNPRPVPGRDVPLPDEVAAQHVQIAKDSRPPVTPVPGRDVPYPPGVEAQRKRMNAGGLTGQLTPEGLDIAAEQFYQTGQMPAMGMGAAGVRTQIINRAAELHPGAKLAANSAEYAANKGSLAALQKNRDAVVSFESTALKNLDQFMSTAKSVVDSGSPLVNQPLRRISRLVAGSPNVAAYEAARRVAVNEIAKVTSNPNLTGQLSDAARKEVESFIPENATLGQVYNIAKVLKQDMTNRHQSLDDQIQAIQGRIQGGQHATSGGRPPLSSFEGK